MDWVWDTSFKETVSQETNNGIFWFFTLMIPILVILNRTGLIEIGYDAFQQNHK